MNTEIEALYPGLGAKDHERKQRQRNAEYNNPEIY